MSGTATDKQNALMQTVFRLRAKVRSRTQTFSCFLDEQPSSLVPRRARAAPCPPTREPGLVVNASFRYQRGDAPPDEIQRAGLPLDGFLRGCPIAWVADAGPGLWMPFWARGEWAQALETLQPGLPAPRALPPAVRETLVRASILVPPDHEQARRTEWETILQAARAQHQTRGYAVVRDLIHPWQIGALRQYYRPLVAAGGLPLGDNQVAERYWLHSEPMARFFHLQLTRFVSQIADEPTRPSYVYFASYQPGSALPRHVDREQCEFSISLLVDYDPEPDGPCGWPLFLDDPRRPGDVVAADLGLGDALFYRGRELYHYRDRLPDGHQSTSYFLHYVREDYAGRLW
jgi:hypothetical protein